MTMEIYDYEVNTIQDEKESLNKVRGKVLLIVNTATGCGFTPQYEGLEKLYKNFHDQGFEILDFPCNQFGHQAPGTNESIAAFCQTTYQTTFQTFAKIEVNGKNEAPLYSYLKENTNGKRIKWNFTKFLVSRDGKTIQRFSSVTTPEKIESDIVSFLNASE